MMVVWYDADGTMIIINMRTLKNDGVTVMTWSCEYPSLRSCSIMVVWYYDDGDYKYENSIG